MPKATRTANGTSGDDVEEEGPVDPKKVPNYHAQFASCLKRIQTTRRDVSLERMADLDRCKQGQLGDCFFVAPVGAAVHRDPLFVKNSIALLPGGGYKVKFSNEKSVEIGALTDAEVAMSSTTGDEGLWLPVLEKAFGSMRRDAAPEKYGSKEATDAISHGGQIRETLQLVTGHACSRVFVPHHAKFSVESGGKPEGKRAGGQLTVEPVADVREIAEKVRKKVFKAVEEKRLVAAGTSMEIEPPGMSPRHAYAILGCDAHADMLTIWNPHGNTFTPKGPVGLKNGYATKAGIFRMPVNEFVQVFRDVFIEEPESDKAEAKLGRSSPADGRSKVPAKK